MKVLLPFVIATGLATAQGTLTANQPHTGDHNVTGVAVGATSLFVYDLSTGGKRYLGSGSSIDKKGNFAVAVNPPLTSAQKIVVVDGQGRSSVVRAVETRPIPKGPAALPAR